MEAIMRRQLPFLIAFAAALVSAEASAQPAPSVEVRFDNPKRFTDLRVERWRDPRQTEALVKELRAWIEREAPRHLPAGAKLTVTVTDVDMAGEFEPLHHAGAVDVRVVRDIYPSRVRLLFSLADDSGKVLKEGERNLVSSILASGSLRGGNGPLGYEKELLREWLGSEFGGVARAPPARLER
jgi:hypothetical protein